VVQNVYFLLKTKSFPALLTSDDVFACLLGAAIHDYQHPGMISCFCDDICEFFTLMNDAIGAIGQNNAFQVATSTDIAIRYNDRSVLENMHCAEAFSVMKVT
jgi:hypothetical protein